MIALWSPQVLSAGPTALHIDVMKAVPLAFCVRAGCKVSRTGGVTLEVDLLQTVHTITRTVELIGILVILAGATYSARRFVRAVARAGTSSGSYKQVRSDLGRSILLGLELLVAADIINTVAVQPTLRSIAVLAGMVLIRTFLSFSLEVEIEGRWPWQPPRKRERPAQDSSGRPEAQERMYAVAFRSSGLLA
ncbi:DUF1622 domain-containing protein [Sphingomonas xinjiangensis]|uniref:Putative membrane protein n=1 Tax=Sphingomonas xinjiangensis TaxID=643568 RepID=A0A840YPR5_9SPHN|nr:DUF1622 domain-containing protein [Sphingomonas xinjiangensis]MBB5710012.1 putative membrane protein [Sphingomonas xinjiangensis]